MKKKNILITGANGFVGSHFLDFLVKNYPNNYIWLSKRWHLSNLKNIENHLNSVKLIDCDITDPISTRQMIMKVKPNFIFHFAAESFVSPSWENPTRYMNVNYNGTLNILDAIKFLKLKTKILIPGSGEEYGEIYKNEVPITPETVLRPVNPYAVSKIAQDLIGYVYYKSYGINVIRTRSFNHEGPRRQNVFGIPWYAYQIAKIEKNLQKPIIEVGGIDDERNFTHVKDIVEGYWQAMTKCKPGELYLLGSEDKKNISTFRNIIKMLFKLSHKKNIKFKINSKYVRPTRVPLLIGDTKKFRKLTKWKPQISLNTILLDTLNYWRDELN